MKYVTVNLEEIIGAVKATDKEYFEAVTNAYGKELASIIKQGEAMAKQMTSGKILSEKSDNGNLIVRWCEGKNTSAILGIVAVSGKLKKSDLPDFKNWTDRIINKLKEGHTILTSPNKLSKPLLDKILQRAGKEGLNVSTNTMGEYEYGGMTWENIVIES